MASVLSRYLSCLVPVLLALLFVAGESRPAMADAECFQRNRNCWYRAAAKESYWEMWAAGMDCELELADCVRRYLIGR